MGQLFVITGVAEVINAWRPTRWHAGDGEIGAAVGGQAARGDEAGPQNEGGGS